VRPGVLRFGGLGIGFVFSVVECSSLIVRKVTLFRHGWRGAVGQPGMSVGVCDVIEETILGAYEQVRDAVSVPIDDCGAG